MEPLAPVDPQSGPSSYPENRLHRQDRDVTWVAVRVWLSYGHHRSLERLTLFTRTRTRRPIAPSERIVHPLLPELVIVDQLR